MTTKQRDDSDNIRIVGSMQNVNHRHPSFGFREDQVAGGLLPQTRNNNNMNDENERMNRSGIYAYDPTPHGGGFDRVRQNDSGMATMDHRVAGPATSIDIHVDEGGDGRQRVAQSYPSRTGGGAGGSGMLTSAAEGATRAGVRLRVAIDGALGLKKNKKNSDLSSKTQ